MDHRANRAVAWAGGDVAGPGLAGTIDADGREEDMHAETRTLSGIETTTEGAAGCRRQQGTLATAAQRVVPRQSGLGRRFGHMLENAILWAAA